jgi:signal transduction histidine kinase
MALKNTSSTSTSRADALFIGSRQRIYVRTDRLFACLMLVQWLVCVATALWLTPLTWVGTTSSIHSHVWAAFVLGGLVSCWPAFLAWRWPGRALTRHSIAAGQMLMSALLIHLTGGRIETHFHVFGSLAILAFYRDWRVLVTATVIVAADHFVRGLLWPLSVYGDSQASPWRWLEHAGWVVFEDVFLLIAIHQSTRQAREIADRQAELETTNERIEAQVRQRTVELESVYQQLVTAARHAGMAEIAIGVLHNVGNVLNSVNTTAGVAIEHARALPTGDLEKVAQLIAEHENSLAAFLTGDPRGKGVPKFITLLANQLSTQRNDIVDQLTTLSHHVDHIKRIVRAQQSFAKVAGLVETVSLEEMIQSAVSFSSAAMHRHFVTVISRFGRMGDVHIDKHRVLQIVINLLTNAKQALAETVPDQRRIEVFAEVDDADHVVIAITDNGKGITAENLQQMFRFGFTTRKDGNGFGLHSGALAAKEMGGSLTAHSDGPGTGARFTLRIPQAPTSRQGPNAQSKYGEQSGTTDIEGTAAEGMVAPFAPLSSI